MEMLYENSGLFSELGDLLGHDPTLYEESDVSSFSGDITKQFPFDEFTPNVAPQMEASMASYDNQDDLSDLLGQGTMLLEQLMTANGLELSSDPTVDLADIDELFEQREVTKPTDVFDDTLGMLDMYPTYEKQDESLYLPVSPVSTLPSEPSSPIQLFAFTDDMAPLDTPVNQSIPHQEADELNTLLSSLLDDGCDFQDASYSDSQMGSPSSSEYTLGSDCSSPVYGSEYSLSPSPKPVKKSKKKTASIPYSKLPAGRKERKKLQNKEAAIRYRQKKKEETNELSSVENGLLDKNTQLKAEVTNLEREIMCMKELLSDVFNIHSFS